MQLTVKEAFQEIRKKLAATGLVDITVYWNKDFSKNLKSIAGFVQYWKSPAVIIVRKCNSYKDLIVTLLHEYSHVLDYRRYKNSRRWKSVMQFEYEDSDVSSILSRPKYVKQDILKTEYIAQIGSLNLIKKLGYMYLFDESELLVELANQTEIRKYEMINGKLMSRHLVRECRRKNKNRSFSIDKKYLKDLLKF